MADEYPLKDSDGYLGHGFIIVNGFDHSERERTGMEAEITLLDKIFISLGLKTKICRNLTANGFRSFKDEINKTCVVSTKDSMVAMAICSHGYIDFIEFMPENSQKSVIEVEENENDVFEGETSAASEVATDGEKNILNQKDFIGLDDVTDSFSASQFDGIPKLFIINACRGKRPDSTHYHGDKIIIFSTLSLQNSLKSNFNGHGDVPHFLIYLYKELRQVKDILIADLVKKINNAMSNDKVLVSKGETQMCEDTYCGALKKLRLKKIWQLEEIDEVLPRNHFYQRRDSIIESDSVYQFTEEKRAVQIKGPKSISCIVISKEDDSFYFADPIAGKVFVLVKKKCYEIDFGQNSLKNPRFVEYFPKKRFLFVSHESGVVQVVMDKNNPKNPASSKPLKQNFLSPCLAGDKKNGLLYILNRIGEESNKVMKIYKYNVEYEEMDNPPHIITISETIPKFYAPIILDMKLTNPEMSKPTIIILVYYPSPILLYTNLENSETIFRKLEYQDPVFLAVLDKSVILSCPDSNTIGILNDFGGDRKPISMSRPNALVYDSKNDEMIITSFQENNCKLIWQKIFAEDARTCSK